MLEGQVGGNMMSYATALTLTIPVHLWRGDKALAAEMITLLIGLDRPLALVAAIFHIMNHATFKASLFMAAGIIDRSNRGVVTVSGPDRLPVGASSVVADVLDGVATLSPCNAWAVGRFTSGHRPERTGRQRMCLNLCK